MRVIFISGYSDQDTLQAEVVRSGRMFLPNPLRPLNLAGCEHGADRAVGPAAGPPPQRTDERTGRSRDGLGQSVFETASRSNVASGFPRLRSGQASPHEPALEPVSGTMWCRGASPVLRDRAPEVRVRDVRDRAAQVRLVDEVEHLSAQLETVRALQAEVLEERDVRCWSPGFRTMSRVEFPNLPPAGLANAFGEDEVLVKPVAGRELAVGVGVDIADVHRLAVAAVAHACDVVRAGDGERRARPKERRARMSSRRAGSS